MAGTILVVDDNETNLRLINAVLKTRGYDLLQATSGEAALEMLAAERPALILMDVQMPGMDGLETTRLIRIAEEAAGRCTPVIAVTAHALKGDRERFLTGGMDGYIAKPLLPDELQKVIREVYPSAVAPRANRSEAALISRPVVDLDSVLAHLGGNHELLRDVVGLFREHAAKLMGQLRDAIKGEDWNSLRRAAHTLKGSVNFFGVPKIKELAEQLERIGASKNLAGISELMELLTQEVNQLLDTLNQVDLP